MTFLLQFTNSYKERYYFVRLGLQWPHDPSKRLIDATTRKKEEARVFTSAEDAREVLVVAGRPAGWEVVEL